MICFIIPREGKFATVIDGKLIGTSKHKDYSVFHWKARDVQSLKRVELTKFVFVDRTGKADEVIDCSALEGRGNNFVTAKRSTAELTAEETALMQTAVNIAAGRPADHAEPTSAGGQEPAAQAADAEQPNPAQVEAAAAEPAAAAAAEAEAEAEAEPAGPQNTSTGAEDTAAAAEPTATGPADPQEAERKQSPGTGMFRDAQQQHASRKMNKRQAAMARVKGRSS